MSLRLFHLSDIHFGDQNETAVAAAAELIAAERADLTIVSGDLTRFGEVPEFQAAAAWLKALPGPILVTAGNHDAPYIAWAQRIFTPFARFEAAIGPAAGLAHRAPGLTAVGINTARGAQPRLNWSKGQIAGRQVEATLTALGAAGPGDLKVVVCHHPLTEMMGAPMTGRVWGGTEAAQRLAEGGADLVLTGHVHVPFALAYPFGDGRSYAVGAGTLSVRERGVPAGFNRIDVDEATVTVTALAWTGSHFEPWRTWALERRAPA